MKDKHYEQLEQLIEGIKEVMMETDTTCLEDKYANTDELADSVWYFIDQLECTVNDIKNLLQDFVEEVKEEEGIE